MVSSFFLKEYFRIRLLKHFTRFIVQLAENSVPVTYLVQIVLDNGQDRKKRDVPFLFDFILKVLQKGYVYNTLALIQNNFFSNCSNSKQSMAV